MLSRRKLLVLGAGSAALLALGGGAALLARPVWDAHGKFLQPGVEVITAIAAALLDGALPEANGAQTTQRSAALAGVVQRIEGALQAMPTRTQQEFAQLVALLAHPMSRTAMGMRTDWQHASPALVSDWLSNLRFSRLSLNQQAYHALHDLTLAAYYSDTQTWAAIGYELPVKI
jgi:hypothetical protein